jgi:hypothetical protein
MLNSCPALKLKLLFFLTASSVRKLKSTKVEWLLLTLCSHTDIIYMLISYHSV